MDNNVKYIGITPYILWSWYIKNMAIDFNHLFIFGNIDALGHTGQCSGLTPYSGIIPDGAQRNKRVISD